MILMFLFVLLQLTTPAVGTATLTVLGGSGGGTYPCGASVKISADRKNGDLVFNEWTGVPMGSVTIDPVHKRRTTVKLDCANTTVKAMYNVPAPPKK